MPANLTRIAVENLGSSESPTRSEAVQRSTTEWLDVSTGSFEYYLNLDTGNPPVLGVHDCLLAGSGLGAPAAAAQIEQDVAGVGMSYTI